MALSAGVRLGPYEIVAPIGAGGMGEVYKARDTRLGRTVAIKVLAAGAADDPDRRRRFEQEARAASALNHSHICVLHDIGSDSGIDFLVMEHLEGQTLAERIATRGALPLVQALEYAIQIADALANAHRHAIVHRDLKPGNIMLTKEGAKLLDFGLARLTQASGGSGASATLSAVGTVVGTVPYMAPEQVQGRETDARTDLFAFGAVLYEMLTGKRAFDGESQASVIAAILERDPPPMSTLQPVTPAPVERVVRKCLAKDPDARWQSASDLRDELRWLTGGSNAIGGPATSTPPARRGRWRIALAIAAVAALSASGGGALWPMLTSTPVRPLPVALDLSLEGTGLAPPSDVAISPDGTVLVFASTDGKQPRLYARNIREREIKPLEGTEDASVPCFSPDGASVAFMSPKGLLRVPVTGGPPFVIYPNEAGVVGKAGMTWGADGRIVFVRQMEQGRAVLWRVPAKGGPREMLMQSDGRDAGIRYFWPQMLPGGRAVLFTIVHRGHATVAAFSLDTHTLTPLVEGTHGRYVPATGHLVYQSDGHLFGVPFNPETLDKGEPYAVTRDVGDSTLPGGEYDVSLTGTLIYLPPTVARLAWKDRNDVATPLGVKVEGRLGLLTLSPDGRRVVIAITRGPAQQLYIANVDGEWAPTRLTPGDADPFGIFTPDGRQVLFTSGATDGRYNIFSTRADGGGSPARQTNSPDWQKASSVGPGPSGDTFLYNDNFKDAFDIWEQRLGKPETARPLVRTSADELEAQFSPDGRWIAYVSNLSRRYEIYVQGYPDGPRKRVSADGGERLRWSRSGRELFYQKSTAVLAVQIVNGARVGPPTRLFRANPLPRLWDVAPGDERFLVGENVRSPQINVVTNWFEELKAKVPPKR